MRKALVLVAALLLSGCASEEPSSGATTVAGEMPGATAPFLAPPTPLRFASGDYNGTMHGDSTFSITQQCIFLDGACEGGEEVFDLSEIVPAGAPVELVVDVHGARASMEFIDASYIGEADAEFQGQGTSFANIVVRGESGKVLLHVYNPGGFGFPPNPSPTASFDANSVVRSDRLVADVPASLKMSPGQSVNLTSEDVEAAVFISPDGTVERRSVAPFTFTANGTAGMYTLLMVGQGSTAVTGPKTDMVARRTTLAFGEVQQLASGQEHTWSFTPEGLPLMVGVDLHSAQAAGFFGVGTVVTDYAVTLTGPGGVAFIDEASSCGGPCTFSLVGGRSTFGFSSEYLDERLTPGSFDVAVTYTGNNMQATSWSLSIV